LWGKEKQVGIIMQAHYQLESTNEKLTVKGIFFFCNAKDGTEDLRQALYHWAEPQSYEGDLDGGTMGTTRVGLLYHTP
jgi:hypothetical protein